MASCNTDIELMLRVKQGDEQAFEELADRYRQSLTGFFYSLCWNLDSAQDHAQEVLLRVWLARERYEPSAKLLTYIYRIARNCWLTSLRRRKSRPEPMYYDEAWQPITDEGSLERLIIQRYIDRQIKLAVSGLPEHYRLVFVLSHFQEMKYREISDILQIPVGTVKSRMSSAVRILKEQISKEMRDEL